MKLFVLLNLILAPMISFANSSKGTADWVTETGTLLIEGQAAADLYTSLDAPETLDPLSTKYDEYRTKENKFAKCSVSFYREDLADGDVEWVMQNNAVCYINAPAGTTIKE